MSASVAFLGPARLSGELRAGLGGRAHLSSFAWGRRGRSCRAHEATRRDCIFIDNGLTTCFAGRT